MLQPHGVYSLKVFIAAFPLSVCVCVCVCVGGGGGGGGNRLPV